MNEPAILGLIPGFEPDPRPADPGWRWTGLWWATETDQDGATCRIFPSSTGTGYLADVAVGSNVHFGGGTYRDLDEAAKDVALLRRLARLYQLHMHLSHPLGLGSLGQPMPPEFHPQLRHLIFLACERLQSGSGDLDAGEHVSTLLFGTADDLRLDWHDVAALLAFLVREARALGYAARKREEASELSATRDAVAAACAGVPSQDPVQVATDPLPPTNKEGT